MKTYELTARGQRWNDSDEVLTIQSDSAENAITKARILKGRDFYDRLYMITEDGELVREYYSYGMLREQVAREIGRGRSKRSWSFMFD